MTAKYSALESLVTFRNSQGEEARGTLLKLERSAVVFEVYNPYSIVQLSEVLHELTIRRGERVIYRGRAVVSNLVNTGLMLIVSVTLVDAWRDLTGLLSTAAGIITEVERFVSDWRRANELRPGFQLVVGRLRSLLSQYNRWLEQVDIALKEENVWPEIDEKDFLSSLSEPFNTTLSDLCMQFEDEAEQVPQEQLADHKSFMQLNLHPLLMRAPVLHRTFYKPLGYAGDYEVMNIIQTEEPAGPTAYSKIINNRFINIPIARSVANRTDALGRYLSKEVQRVSGQGKPLRVLSIACGPAREVQNFVRIHPLAERSEFDLLDFDPRALAHARSKIQDAVRDSSCKVHVETIHESVHKLLKQAANRNDQGIRKEYDMIYSSGLFDYLSDKVCSRLLRLFYRWLAPGGLLYVTNMHTCNPDRYMMEFIMEWYLIYRDEKCMGALVPDLGIQHMHTDSTGVNLGLEIRKPQVSTG